MRRSADDPCCEVLANELARLNVWATVWASRCTLGMLGPHLLRAAIPASDPCITEQRRRHRSSLIHSFSSATPHACLASLPYTPTALVWWPHSQPRTRWGWRFPCLPPPPPPPPPASSSSPLSLPPWPPPPPPSSPSSPTATPSFFSSHFLFLRSFRLPILRLLHLSGCPLTGGETVVLLQCSACRKVG